MSITVQLLKEQLLGQQLNSHEVAFLTLLQQNAPEEYRVAKEKAEKEIGRAGITQTIELGRAQPATDGRFDLQT